MKKILMFLMLGFVMTKAIGQALISPINITLPANPSANTADWGTGTNIFVISAQTRPVQGQINGNVQESKILVTIKKGGTKVCGSYTESTAPSANFNAPTKTWTGATAAGLLGTACTLAPGDYTLCVKFIAPFSTVNLGDEVCKPFTIRDAVTPPTGGNPGVSQSKFTPPVNVAPVNNAIIKTEDAKKPLTFRWVPPTPKPQIVKYKLRVWQVGKEQTATAAIKANTPVIEREVNNQTQFVKPNLLGDIELVNGQAQLTWNVQALNENGSVLGQSEPTMFMVGGNQARAMSQYQIETKNIAISCTNTFGQYNYTLDLKNPNATTAKFITLGVSSSLPAGATITSISPSIGTTIPSGNQITITGTITSSAMLTNFCFKTGIEESGFPDNNAQTVDCINVPPCKCTTCDQVEWKLPESIKFDTSGIRATNNVMTLYGGLSFGPQKPVKVSAEIIDFYWYTEGDCKKCSNNDYYFGNLVSGDLGTTIGTSPNDNNGAPIPSSHQLDFIFNNLNGVTVNNTPMNLNITVPKQTTLSCCTDCFRFCIRYTATFMENGVCKTCTIVKCYETKRKHKKVGAILQYQVNQCGDSNIINDNHNAIDTKNNNLKF